MTTDQLAQSLKDSGLDTPEKFTTFIQTALLQVKVNSLNLQLQRIAQDQSAAIAANTTARESKQSEIATTQAQLLALISAQS